MRAARTLTLSFTFAHLTLNRSSISVQQTVHFQCVSLSHHLLSEKISSLREQDGRGVGGCGVHLSPQIHQEYTFRHRGAGRTPAESKQEYLSSSKEYIEPCKTRKDEATRGRNRSISRTGPSASGGTEARVQSPHRGSYLSQRRNI